MSMYAINSGLPKTLVRYIVGHVAETSENEGLRDVLADILSTPVSAELLPPIGGEISQLTESLIGPYELQDFIIYHALRYGRSAKKIFGLAEAAFGSAYSKDEILRWMKVFYRNFISQQFKRSCMPDGPAIGPVSLSPRNGLKMPSDAVSDVWLRELEQI
jgi:NAD+ synthase (glutamine-hydrolysing)